MTRQQPAENPGEHPDGDLHGETLLPFRVTDVELARDRDARWPECCERREFMSNAYCLAYGIGPYSVFRSPTFTPSPEQCVGYGAGHALLHGAAVERHRCGTAECCV